MSSAYAVHDVKVGFCSRSAIKRIKRSGPTIEPCGTPDVIKPK